MGMRWTTKHIDDPRTYTIKQALEAAKNPEKPAVRASRSSFFRVRNSVINRLLNVSVVISQADRFGDDDLYQSAINPIGQVSSFLYVFTQTSVYVFAHAIFRPALLRPGADVNAASTDNRRFDTTNNDNVIYYDVSEVSSAQYIPVPLHLITEPVAMAPVSAAEPLNPDHLIPPSITITSS